MALREGLPNNMLYADGASMMRNFFIIVAWHGGSPRVSTSCTDPRGSIISLENLYNTPKYALADFGVI